LRVKEIAVAPVSQESGHHVGLHGQYDDIALRLEEGLAELGRYRIGIER